MEKPKVNGVVRVLFLITGVLWIFVCLWSIRDAYFPAEIIHQKHPLPTDTFYLFNKALALISSFIGAMFFLLAKKLNRSHGSKQLWIAILLIHLAYMFFLMSPIALGVLIFWCSKKNRAYHFASVIEFCH
jgi:hypothetical protein